jgi:hypothetical protein
MAGSVLGPGLVGGIFYQWLEQGLHPGGRVEGVPCCFKNRNVSKIEMFRKNTFPKIEMFQK